MAVLVSVVSADTFDQVFANRQRALVLARHEDHMPGNLVEVTDTKRRCQRLITHVDAAFGGVLEGLALVSLRPLTSAEKGERMTGEGPA